MTDKMWCLTTEKHVAMVPHVAIERMEEGRDMQFSSTAPAPSIKMVLLTAIINLVLTSIVLFFVWNYAIVSAVTFAKSVSIFQAVGLTAFINLVFPTRR